MADPASPVSFSLLICQMCRRVGVGSVSIGVDVVGVSTAYPLPPVPERPVSIFGRSRRILTTSVSLVVAPSMKMGPASPG